MRVLFVTSEITPLVKTGGLADVSGALPAALRALGVDVRVLLPGYANVLQALPSLHALPHKLTLAGFPDVRLLLGALPDGVPLIVIDCPALYARGGGPYQDESGADWVDNAQRFGLLSWVAALLSSSDLTLGWKPDLVHCNDWQSGLAPAHLHFSMQHAPSVMTVHNLAFQGAFPAYMSTQLGLPEQSYQPEGVEFYGNLSFLKAGLYFADHITTVSPTYAREIQGEELGFGMQGLLTRRNNVLTGILNGIDTAAWDPATDLHLARTYDAADLSGKAANKRALQERMGLRTDTDIPLFGLVSRFTYQKGVDTVLKIATALFKLPAQLVLLGNGDEDLQQAALELAHSYPGKMAVQVGFDEGLSHLIEAGADIFLMPSRFEPCGLNQMYSQRYGTPPLVHATGGLIDSVVDCTPQTLALGTASGFVFNKMDAPGLLAAARRAVTIYRDKKTWQALQRSGMGKDFGWEKSAAAYRDIYTQVLDTTSE